MQIIIQRDNKILTNKEGRATEREINVDKFRKRNTARNSEIHKEGKNYRMRKKKRQ